MPQMMICNFELKETEMPQSFKTENCALPLDCRRL